MAGLPAARASKEVLIIIRQSNQVRTEGASIGRRYRRKAVRLFAAALAFLLLTTASGCSGGILTEAGYQTFASAIQDDIAQLMPTTVPQKGGFQVSDDTIVQEIGSEQDLFYVLQTSLYTYTSDVYIQIESYDLFTEFWNSLSSAGALHSAFETNEVKIEYDNRTPCTMRLIFEYNSAGQILRSLRNGNPLSFDDPDVQRLYNVSEQILSNITTACMTDLQKETAIHDYLVTHTQYSTEGDVGRLATADSVILDSKGQCQGYAEAASLLLGISGIPSRVISGSATGPDGKSAAHAWNQVLIGGVWYHVDVTWDDPIPDTGSYASRTYLNRSDDFMRTDHTWSPLFQPCPVDSPVPAADGVA